MRSLLPSRFLRFSSLRHVSGRSALREGGRTAVVVSGTPAVELERYNQVINNIYFGRSVPRASLQDIQQSTGKPPDERTLKLGKSKYSFSNTACGLKRQCVELTIVSHSRDPRKITHIARETSTARNSLTTNFSSPFPVNTSSSSSRFRKIGLHRRSVDSTRRLGTHTSGWQRQDPNSLGTHVSQQRNHSITGLSR